MYLQKRILMGKIKSEIPRGHFVFRNAPNAKGEHALNLQYVCNGVPVYKSTGIFLHPDIWNAATQEVRAKCPDATRINRRLKEFRNSIDEQIENYDEVITVEVLRSIIKGTYGQTGKDTPFIQYAVKLNGKVRYLPEEQQSEFSDIVKDNREETRTAVQSYNARRPSFICGPGSE